METIDYDELYELAHEAIIRSMVDETPLHEEVKLTADEENLSDEFEQVLATMADNLRRFVDNNFSGEVVRGATFFERDTRKAQQPTAALQFAVLYGCMSLKDARKVEIAPFDPDDGLDGELYVAFDSLEELIDHEKTRHQAFLKHEIQNRAKRPQHL